MALMAQDWVQNELDLEIDVGKKDLCNYYYFFFKKKKKRMSCGQFLHCRNQGGFSPSWQWLGLHLGFVEQKLWQEASSFLWAALNSTGHQH